METKLTLRLNQDVISRAKSYAKLHNISLSKMIEIYLDLLTSAQKNAGDSDLTPRVKRLLGVVDLNNDFDYRQEIDDYLKNKYQ